MFNAKKLLILIAAPVVLSACTFGEGPELSVPGVSTTLSDESDDSGEMVFSDSSSEADIGQMAQQQVANGQSSQIEQDQTAVNQNVNQNVDIQAEDNQVSLDDQVDGNQAQTSSVVSTNGEPSSTVLPQELVVPTSTDDNAPTENAPTENNGQPNLVRIPATDSANAPRIDGGRINYIEGTQSLDGEWRFSAQQTAGGQTLSIANRMFGESRSSLGAGQHHWAAMHDEVYLYLLVISDDASEHFQDTNETRKPWKDDSIEIFIDGNNSRLDDYDGVDDFHLTINLQSSERLANTSYIETPLIRQSDSSATLPSDLLFSTGPVNGPLGFDQRGRKDIYEIRIKLSELNIQLEQPFGIEIQINDDDDGGTRDEKWGWHHPEGTDDTNDFTWQNPSVMGQAVLLR